MKKHIIAAAVAAAVAVPAMAQNVQVYGILDQAFVRSDDGTARAAANQPKINANLQSLLATQRFGVKGTEDIGGGLKLNFVLEGGLGGTTAFAGFARAQYVELAGSFGSVSIGWRDLGTTNIDDFVSQAGNLGAMMTGADGAAISNATGNGDGLGNDNSNKIIYTTPTVGGFKAEIGYSAPHTTAAATTGGVSRDADGTVAAETQTGIRIDFEQGPLKAAIGMTKGASTGNSNNDRKLTAFGAAYDLGVASVGYSLVKAEPTAAIEHKYNLFSAKVPMSDGLALHGVYQTAQSNGATEKAEGYTLAVTKALSKRTTLYGAYSAIENRGANAVQGGTLGKGFRDSKGITLRFLSCAIRLRCLVDAMEG